MRICGLIAVLGIATHAMAADPSPWGNGRWLSRGPANLSGLVNAFLFDPDDRSTYFAGTRTGLWISRDEGKSWSNVESMIGTNIEGLARDPANHNTLYAASGIDGVFKSTDRGVTWTRLSTTIRSFSVAVSSDGKRVLASTGISMQLSTDGGATWQRVALGGVIQGRVRFHPTDPLRAIAVFPIIDSEGDDSGFRTIDYSTDGGVSWHQAAGLDANVDGLTVEYCRDQPSVVIAFSTVTPAVDGKIWRSDDGGVTFRSIGTARTFAGGMRVISAMAAPQNPDLIVVGALSSLRTRDGGKTTDYVMRPINGIDVPHADVHGIAAEPGSNKRVVLWGDGGIYRTEDITADSVDWVPLTGGLANTQIYDFDVTPSGRVIAGMQDTGFAVMNAGTAMTHFHRDGDVGQVAFDPTDDNVFFTAFFGDNSSGAGTVHKWVGTAETIMYADTHAGQTYIGPGSGTFAIDPNNPTRLYIGSFTIQRLDGIQSTPKPPRVTTIRTYAAPVMMSTLAVKPGDSNVVWVITRDGSVERLDRTIHALSDAPEWETITTIPESWGRTWSIQFDRNDANIVYVLCNNALGVTRDAGKTWTAALAKTGLFAFARHPQRPDWWYVGGTSGLSVSTDSGTTWQPSPTLGNQYIRALHFIGSQTLWASVWSQGLWSLEIPASPRRRAVR